jgi:hypothetical protein
MRSTSEEVSKIAKDFLEKNEIEYVSISKPMFFNSSYTGNKLNIDHWSVPYEYKVFQNENAFIEIEDESKKIIHVVTKHGFEYIDGVDKAEDNDDGENWDDI